MKRAKRTKPAKRFIIVDWANNRMWPRKTFESFEDGWEYIYEKFSNLEGDDFDEQMGEFSVIEEDGGAE